MTVQGVPEGVQPPEVTAVSPFTLHVSWSEPSHQNGVIRCYHLNLTGVGTIFTHTDGPKNFSVTGRACIFLLFSLDLPLSISFSHVIYIYFFSF